MYNTAAGVKRDPVRRWHLPDCVFFACRACHILTYAFLQKYTMMPVSLVGGIYVCPSICDPH